MEEIPESMSAEELIRFFDRNAETWDEHLRPRDHDVGRAVLGRIGAGPGDTVLDAACGTGVLAPLLAERGVKDITAVDISPGMEKVFRRKHPAIKFITADYHDPALFAAGSFSLIILYNAFPHFRDPAAIIRNAWTQLAAGGRLLIAHSMNRTELDLKHKEVGGIVGNHMLVCDAELRQMLEAAGFSSVVIEDADYFYLSAVKK